MLQENSKNKRQSCLLLTWLTVQTLIRTNDLWICEPNISGFIRCTINNDEYKNGAHAGYLRSKSISEIQTRTYTLKFLGSTGEPLSPSSTISAIQALRNKEMINKVMKTINDLHKFNIYYFLLAKEMWTIKQEKRMIMKESRDDSAK